MVSLLPHWNRRAFILGAVSCVGLPIHILAGQAPDSFEMAIDPALLEPAAGPANWDVERNYSTDTIPATEPTEYCDVKLFPYVPDSTVAVSGVMQANDLHTSPNMVLVQEFRYASSDMAITDFPGVVHEVQTLAAGKLYLKGIEAFTEVRATATESLVTHAAPNGTNWALLVMAVQDRILVLRAGARDMNPAAALEEMAAGIMASAQATPAGGESANIELDWEIANWRWNYGPIDIHPARYASPVCG